jgi:exodeoxyribonuclease VII small subunit
MAENNDNLTFEEALERLESVVRELESNETGLDKSLERYEDGVRLLKRCRKILDEAERKIRLLTGVDAEGNPVTVEFDGTSTAERDAANNCEPAEPGKRTTERAPRRRAVKDRPLNAEDLF